MRILLAICFAALSINAPLNAQQPPPDQSGRPGFPPPGRRGGGPPPAGERGEGKWWQNPSMARKLGLTRDQQRKLEDVFQQHRLKLIDLTASLDREQAILDPLLASDHPQESSVLAQFDRVAQARLEAAEQHFAFVDAAARPDDRARAEAEIRAAEASLSNAQALFEKTIVRSPLDAVVLRRYRKTGESVIAKDETPIVSLGATSRLRVRVDVDETDVNRLREGQKAWVRADAYGDRRFTGRVVRIGQILGPKNISTDRAAEKLDAKILETLVELDPGQTIPVGLRVDAYIQVDSR